MIDRTTRNLERQRKASFELERDRLTLERKKVELDHTKLTLEDRRLTLEESKFALEDRKLALEARKTAVNLYVEDFKARWQELILLSTIGLLLFLPFIPKLAAL